MKLFWYTMAAALNISVGVNAWLQGVGLIIGIATITAAIFIFLIIVELYSKREETREQRT